MRQLAQNGYFNIFLKTTRLLKHRGQIHWGGTGKFPNTHF
jgi:hypothetical protein